MIKAHAKINLGLYITGKRDNGYHELCSIFLPLELHDKIDIKEADKFSITATGPFAHDCPTDERNTMFKAHSKLKDFLYKKGIKLNPIHISIEKNIPSQAGLGGGSSDAAGVLKGLNDEYSFGLSTEELKKIGMEIGADVPLFIDEEPALVEGIGETTHPFQLEHNYLILLAKPTKGLGTAEVYKRFTFEFDIEK